MKRLVATLVLTLLSFTSAGVLLPETLASYAPPEKKTNASIVLVVDSSGSMVDSDDGNLRRVSAQLLASLLDTGDQLGLVEFSTQIFADHSFGLTPVGDDASKRFLLDKLSVIGTVTAGFTNMDQAFKQACIYLDDAVSGNARYIVFLTDGAPWTPDWESRNEAQREVYRREVRSAAAKCSASLIPVGLSRTADVDFLSSLPGVVPVDRIEDLRVVTSEELPRRFLQIFAQLADRYIPVQRSTEGQDFIFDASQAVLSATFVFVRSGAECTPPRICLVPVAPGGLQRAPGDPGVSYLGGKDFAVLTVQPVSPGRWRIPAGQIGVGGVQMVVRSRLQLRLTSPPAIQPVGQPVRLAAVINQVDNDGRLVPVQFGRDRSVQAEVQCADASRPDPVELRDDGTQGDEQAEDGIFSSFYTATGREGLCQVRLSFIEGGIPAYGRAEFQLRPFPTLILSEPVAGSTLEFAADTPILLRTQLSFPTKDGRPDTSAKLTRAVISVYGEDGKLIRTEELRPSGSEATGQLSLVSLPAHVWLQLMGEAQYQGVSYPLTGERLSYAVKYVEVVTYEAARPLSFGSAFSVSSLNSTQIRVRSWSDRELKLRISTRGTSGLQVQASTERLVPNTDTSIDLRLTTSGSRLDAGTYTPTLFFEADGVPIRPSIELPAQFTIKQAALTYSLPPQTSVLEFGRAFQVDHLAAPEVKVTLSGESEVALSARVETPEGFDNLTVLPSKITPDMPTSVTLRLVPKPGSQIPVGPRVGRLVFSTMPSVAILPKPQIDFQYELAGPTATHTLLPQDFGSLDNLEKLPLVKFHVKMDLPTPRTLILSVTDENGKPDPRMALIPSSFTLLEKGDVDLQFQPQALGQAGLTSNWIVNDYLHLSAGTDVQILDATGRPMSAVSFRLTQPSGVTRAWRSVQRFLVQTTANVLLPGLFAIIAMVLLYALASLGWFGWQWYRSRPFAVTLKPVTVDALGTLSPDTTRTNLMLRVASPRAQAFGLAMGRENVPLVRQFANPGNRVEEMAGWLERCLVLPWIRWLGTGIPQCQPPSVGERIAASGRATDLVRDAIGFEAQPQPRARVAVASGSAAGSRLRLRFRAARCHPDTVLVARLGGAARKAGPPAASKQVSRLDTSTGGPDFLSAPRARSTTAATIVWRRLGSGKWEELTNRSLLELDMLLYQVSVE